MTALLATLAHPGHGSTDGGSLVHYFAEPVHIALVAAAFVAAGIAVYLLARRIEARE